MSKQDIKEILKRVDSGQYSEEDEQAAKKWLFQLNNQRRAKVPDSELTEVNDRIWARLNQDQPVLVMKHRLWPRIAVAASILMAVSVGGFFILHKEKPAQQVATVHDVLPGGNKAYLTLGNGQRISLTDAKNGTIASQAGKTIQKTADGMIVYDDSHNVHNNAENAFNTIETPIGGQYQVRLPDGTAVWLNASSSLKYPASFANHNKRIVELTGEGYFEVAKDMSHPFVVKTDKQEIEVLGTHFNVNTYRDEPAITTTLLEGSVKISSGALEQVIKPGEQALNSGKAIKVTQASIDNIIDWKDGDFNLDKLDFKVAMRKIARWYDVEVIYDPSVPEDIQAGGWISRTTKLSTVLKLIEKSGQVHFKVEGKKVYVSK